MDKEERLQRLREAIEINKKNAIREIEKEEIISAMWSISSLIDLKAQEGILKRLIEEGKESVENI